MCSACGFPLKPGHWADAGALGAGERLRLRFARMTVINRLLAPYRLKVHDDGATPGLQLFGPTGERVMVPDLDVLWREAARMAGTPIDPLSDAFLADG